MTYTTAFQPATLTDQNGNSSTNHYDATGRVAYRLTPTGNEIDYTYDYNKHTVTATNTGIGSSQITTYDGFGRPVLTQVKSSNGVIVSKAETVYAPCACSPLGKVSKVAQPHDPNVDPVYTVYTYDASGRTLTVTAPDLVSITTYQYQGNTTTVTDPLRKWKKYTADAMGNLVKVEEPNPAGGANLTTSYTYDAMNHLTQVSMPRGSTTQTRSWSYDGNQRLSSATSPESGTVNYVYNPDGTLQYKTDAKGQKTQYTYDLFGRRSQIDYFPAGSTVRDLCQTVKLYYDSSLTSFFTGYALGRLTAATWADDASCTYHFMEQFQYAQQGFLTGKALGMATGSTAYGNAYASFGYDLDGRTTGYCMSKDASNSDCYNYQRDSLGRATGLTQGSSTTIVSGATYGPAGQLLSMRHDYLGLNTDGYTETRQYNTNLQMTRLTATPIAGSAQGIDLEYKFGTGATNGRISEMIDHISGEDVTYQYDMLNRLTNAQTATMTWGLSFQYDGFGNMTSQTRTAGSTAPQWAGTVDGTTNRRTDSGWSYDANGNVTAMPDGSTFNYDVKNRVVSNGAIYDPRNRRVWDGTSLYLYGIGGKLLGIYIPSLGANSYTTRVRYNLWFEGKLIRQDNKWVMIDRLGSVRANGSGERFNYYPYGQEMTPTSDHRTKFATYWRDSAGVDYAEQRYYSSTTGRFLTPDPYRSTGLTSSGTWNRYGYVEGDPVNFRDPRGLFRCSDCDPEPDPEPDPGPSPGPAPPGPPPPPPPPKPAGHSGALKGLRKPDCYEMFGFVS